jgi:hypothetical protein
MGWFGSFLGFAKRDFSSVRLLQADYDLIQPETNASEGDGSF